MKFTISVKELQKELQSVKGNQIGIEDFLNSALNFESGKLVIAKIDMDDRQVLSEITDKIKNKLVDGIVVTIGKGPDSNPLIVSVTKSLSKDHKAGDILKELANELGGKGGGRPDFAQGAVPSLTNYDSAMTLLKNRLGIH